MKKAYMRWGEDAISGFYEVVNGEGRIIARYRHYSELERGQVYNDAKWRMQDLNLVVRARFLSQLSKKELS